MRALAGMHQQVALEVPRSHEALVALRALMGPLTSMDALVHGQVSRLAEGLPTFVAGIGLEALVGSLMPAKAGGVAEHASALRAEKRFLARMGPLVALEGGQLGEAFPAEIAAVGLVGCMDALVAGQR
uniref:Uncharacterized protein n=1 Tax=Micrurus lemniscatus lemniscatus TaxID=129467 RepID=A0A2D4JGK9_MICLE